MELAIAHGFVQQSLGRLDIESEPGRGTAVRMLFPAVAETSGQALPGLEQAETTGESGTASTTVLVVEDNEDVLALATKWLRDLGYCVLSARSGTEALEVLSGQGDRGIDLLLTDLVMPGGINGLMQAERIRASLPDVAVLVTTGYNEDLVALGPRTPSMDVLGKPYRQSELADRVHQALARRNGSDLRRGPMLGIVRQRHEG